MEAKKLLTIALTGLLAGGCLMVPALAEDADGQSSGNPATYTIPARVKRIEDYAFAGDTTLERVAQALGVPIAGSDPEDEFDTIGGLIAHEMGHVPQRGEHLQFCGLHFVVLHTKGGAVRWFKVTGATQDLSRPD